MELFMLLFNFLFLKFCLVAQIIELFGGIFEHFFKINDISLILFVVDVLLL